MGAADTHKVMASLMKWSQRDEWRERCETVFAAHLGPPCDDFEMTVDEVAGTLGDAFTQLLDCAFEDFLTCRFEPDDRNIVDDYLKRRGWKEAAPAKRYLRAFQHSVMSAYEVVETVPGSHFLARDLIRGGEPVRIDDKRASASVATWDRVAARLLPINGKFNLGAGILLLSFEDASEIVDGAFRLRKRLERELTRLGKPDGITPSDIDALPLDDAVLGELAPLFSQTWLASTLEQGLDDSSPSLKNSDDDALIFCKTRFPLEDRERFDEVESRLDALAELSRDQPDLPHWTWRSTAASTRRPGNSRPAKGISLKTVDQDGALVLGSLRLEEETLILHTNSVERAERGRDLLARALGPLVGDPLTHSQTPEQARQARDEQDEDPGSAPSLTPEQAEAAMRQFFDQHYQEALTAPLPVLDGKSPKQAVRSKAGRQKVAQWLKYLENQTERRARAGDMAAYDFTWMWHALKIEHLRH
ncbi:MAG: hypothetical protein ACREH6_04360 [Geminicoccaceae bacterium]